MMAILAVLVLLATQHTCAAIEWGVVIDCGSSHTEVQIYSWGPGQPMAMFTPPKDANLLENGTMAMADPAFVANPSLLGAYFQPLITQAARWVPADKHAATRVRAFATAGMRLYSASTQESMWAPVRAQLAGPATPFAFVSTDATTISGNYEGLFGFLAVNFILNGAPAVPTTRYGALDLGGASTQITFASTASIMADAYSARVGDAPPDRVYSHSYMRAGVDQAQLRLAAALAAEADRGTPSTTPVPNPCLNPGLSKSYSLGGVERNFSGTGDHDACTAKIVASLLHMGYECLQEPCAAAGVYQPDLGGVVPIYAMSAYYYTIAGIFPGVGDTVSKTSTEITAAGRSWCARNWVGPLNHSAAYCFSSAYIPALLQAYGIANTSTQITFARKLQGQSVGWALGAQLYAAQEATGLPVHINPDGPKVEAACAQPDNTGLWVGLLVGWALVALALAYIHKVAGARACGGKQGIAPGESMYSQETADIMGNTK